MTPQRRRRDRGARNRSSRQATLSQPERFVDHPLFGRIPLVPRDVPLASGVIHQSWDYDPTYQPPLPKGAVRGDITKQQYCGACHRPHYFYLDETRRCVQCHADFVFSAGEQKYWYETRQFHFRSIPIRCPACRRRARSAKALAAAVGAARDAVAAHPAAALHQLELSQAVLALRRLNGRGDLNEALAAARRAQRDPATACAALLLEAECQALAGRVVRAREVFTAVIDRFRRDARWQIAGRRRPRTTGGARHTASDGLSRRSRPRGMVAPPPSILV